MVASLYLVFEPNFFFFQWLINFGHQGQYVRVKQPANSRKQNSFAAGVQRHCEPHGWVSLTLQNT